MRSLQSSKENTNTGTQKIFYRVAGNFFMFFASMDLIWIRIAQSFLIRILALVSIKIQIPSQSGSTDPLESKSNPYPDPQTQLFRIPNT
jgi:hypothetical protein